MCNGSREHVYLEQGTCVLGAGICVLVAVILCIGSRELVYRNNKIKKPDRCYLNPNRICTKPAKSVVYGTIHNLLLREIRDGGVTIWFSEKLSSTSP